MRRTKKTFFHTVSDRTKSFNRNIVFPTFLATIALALFAAMFFSGHTGTPDWVRSGAGLVQRGSDTNSGIYPSVRPALSYTFANGVITAQDGEFVTLDVYPQLLETPRKQQVKLSTEPSPPDASFRFVDPKSYPATLVWEAGDKLPKKVVVEIVSDHDGINESVTFQIDAVTDGVAKILDEYKSITVKIEGDDVAKEPGDTEGQGLIRGVAVWKPNVSYCAGPKPSDGTSFDGALNPHMACDSGGRPACDPGWRRFRLGSAENNEEHYYICESGEGSPVTTFEKGRLYSTAVTVSDAAGKISTCAGPNYMPTYSPISCGSDKVPVCDTGFRKILTGRTSYEGGNRLETSYTCERMTGNTPESYQVGGIYGVAEVILQNGSFTKCSGPGGAGMNQPISCATDNTPRCASGFRRVQMGDIMVGGGKTEKYFTCEYMGFDSGEAPVVSFTVANNNLTGTVANLSATNALSCLEVKGRTSGKDAEGYCGSDPTHWTTMPANDWSFDAGTNTWRLSMKVGQGTSLPPNTYTSFWRNSQTGKTGSGTFTVTSGGGGAPLKDIVYSKQLKLDVYPTSSGSAPVVVYIHSGGWFKGDKSADDGVTIPEDLAKKGLNAVSINYTLVPGGYYPTPLQDIDCALRWVAKNASAYGFDASRVSMGGYSSGGHLALLSSMRPNSYTDTACPSASVSRPSVQKIFSLAGPTNLANIGGSVQGMADDFLHGKSAGEASPLTYADSPNGLKYLLVHAKDDELVPFGSQATPFADKLSSWNPPVQKKWYDTGGHLFAFGRSASRYDDTIATISTFLSGGDPQAPRDPKDPNTKVALIGTHHDDEIIFLEPWLHIADKIITPSTYPTSPYMRDHIALKYMTEDKWVAPQGTTDHNTAKYIAHDRPYRLANITTSYLTGLLDPYVKTYDVIATHSPWGEYGHEQHRQIYCVVQELAKKYQKDVYVWNGSPDESNHTGGMPNRFFTLTKNGSEVPFVSLPFDMANYDRVRNVFIQAERDYPMQPGEAYWNNRFWTWDRTWEGTYGKYQPPSNPKFYKLVDHGNLLFDSTQVKNIANQVPIYPPDGGIRHSCY